MLISTVLSPDLLDSKHFDDPLYRISVVQLLKGILSNGVVLVDQDQRLFKRLCEYAAKLNLSPNGQDASMYFAELIAKNNDGSIRFMATSCVVSSQGTEEEITASVALKCKADGTILPKLEGVQMPVDRLKAIAVTDYLLSSLESQRREFAEANVDACDRMTEAKFSELIARSTRFSKKLEFYDKIIGKAHNTRNFLQGIERIVSIWLKAAHFPKSQLSVAIFTVVHRSPSPNKDYDTVNQELRQKLEDRFGIKVSLCFKHDPKGICHARHLRTDSCVIQFERGFDIIQWDGSLKRSFVNLVQRADSHLAQYQALRPFDPSAK